MQGRANLVRMSEARRSYDSTRRRAMAEQTRSAVYDAATDLFARQGWSATSMRDIARAAGVSVETVYSAAGSKLDLLRRVLDIAIVGDAEPVPLAERPEFEALGEGGRRERMQAAARLLTRQHHRTAPLHRTFDHAAAGDDELAATNQELREQQRDSFRSGLRLALGHEPHPETVHGLWALGGPEVYLLLTETAGWTPEQYEQWLALWMETLLTHLPEEQR